MTVLTHLAMPGRSGVSACGRWSKWTTSSAEDVTCEACRKTWDFALARPCCADCRPWPKYPPGGVRISMHGVPRWAFRRRQAA